MSIRWTHWLVLLLLAGGLTACTITWETPPALQTPTADLRPSPTLLTESPLRSPLSPLSPPPTPDARLDAAIDREHHGARMPLIVHFTRPMDPESAPTPLRITPPVAGRYIWDETRTTLIFVPSGGLLPGHKHDVLVTPELASADGQPFVPLATWTLRIEPPPRVQRRGFTHGPRLSAETNDRYQEFYVTFSRAMDRQQVERALDIYPSVPLSTTWDETTLRLQPQRPLDCGSAYELRIDRSAVDTLGTPLDQPFNWTFETLSLIKEASATPTGALEIDFNYAVAPGSVERALALTPRLDPAFDWNDEQTRATLTFGAPLTGNLALTLDFTAVIRDAQGDRIRPPDALNVTTAPPLTAQHLRWDKAHPTTPLRLDFTRSISSNSADAVQITPPISGTFAVSETTLTFTPAAGYFEPKTTYTVTLDTTLRGTDGTPLLARPYRWSFQTQELRRSASFGMGPNLQVLDANGRRALPIVRKTNRRITSYDFALHRLTWAQFLSRYRTSFVSERGWEQPMTPISTTDAVLVRQWTEPVTRTGSFERDYVSEAVQEIQIPADVSPGVYVLDLKSGYVNDQLFLVLTPETLVVKQAEGRLLAWLTDINGDVVPYAPIEIYDADGAVLRSARTDTDGVVRLSLPQNVTPTLVTADHNGIRTLAGLNEAWNAAGRSWWRRPPEPEPSRHKLHTYTDRPIYRPGQRVHFKTIVRRDEDAVLQPLAAGTPITVRVHDPRDNRLRTYALTLNAFGSANGAFDLGPEAALGVYALDVEVAGEHYRQAFKVEDYPKPDYEVRLSAGRRRVVSGAPLTVTVAADYYFGAPVDEAAVTAVPYQLWEVNPWVESETDYYWGQGWEPLFERRDLREGSLTFDVPTDIDQLKTWRLGYHSLRSGLLGIEVTVDDGSHQTVSNFEVVEIFSAAEKLSLNVDHRRQSAGEPFTVTATVRDLDDAPVADREVTLHVQRWNTETRQYEDVGTLDAATNADGDADYRLTLDQAGHYHLVVEATDALGNEMAYETYISTSGSHYGYRGESLSITADQEQYAPGDAARLTIASAFDGPALLTFERGTTRRHQRVTLTAPTTEVAVPIQPTDAPNIYVTVNAWEPGDTRLEENQYRTENDSLYRQATVNLDVPPVNKQLALTITTDQTTYTPRETATFTVSVADARGRPTDAEVSLALVDEAIYALSDPLSPSIFESFYHERERLVETYTTLSIYRTLFVGGGGGGGGAPGPGTPRNDFVDTAAWYPALRTGADGVVSVTLTLPDNLTRWRLTAKAVTPETEVAEAAAHVTTQQDVQLHPQLPTHLTVGDVTTATTFVHNQTSAAQTLTVTLALTQTLTGADRAVLDLPAAPTQTLTVSPGGRGTLHWPLTAAEAGTARLLFWATAEGEARDAVEQTLTVNPLTMPDVLAVTGHLTRAVTATLTLSESVHAEGPFRLELSSSLAAPMLEGLGYLTGFPYGCVEQTMSKALPNAVVGRAVDQLNLQRPDLEKSLEIKINDGLQRLYNYQHGDGGWGWWYDDETQAYQTAWVVFGLAATAQAGYEVDPDVLAQGVTWLDRHLAEMEPRLQAYALYAMASAGQPDVAASRALSQTAGAELSPYGVAALTLSFHEAGETAAAQDLAARLVEQAQVLHGHTYWDEVPGEATYRDYKLMASDVRSTALALNALVKVAPEHPLVPGAVRWLMSRRTAHGWRHTNETAHAVLALTDYLVATGYSPARRTDYTVVLDGQRVATGTLTAEQVTAHLALPALTPGEHQITLRPTNGDDLYYVLRQNVYRVTDVLEPAGEIEITGRRYLDPETGEELTGTVKAGQRVQVELEIQSPLRVPYVVVEDPLPGGLTALNTRLNTTQHVDEGQGRPHWRWREYNYNRKEVYADRVVFFVTDLGVRPLTITYAARATRSGTFTALPTEVSAMYAPTLWGRSGGATLTIAP